MLRFITGGARSGKSSFAEKLVRESPGTTVYIATAVPFDDGMRDRIAKHRQSRPAEWKTVERWKDFEELDGDAAFNEADNVLFDCVTVMITNQMMDSGLDFDSCTMDEVNALEIRIREDTARLLDALDQKNAVIVSNELGSGLVPAYRMGSLFRDIAGRINQEIAARADEVWLAVSGIPVRIKQQNV